MSHTYYYRNTTATDELRDICARIEALVIECDGIGEDDCAELVRLRALLTDLQVGA